MLFALFASFVDFMKYRYRTYKNLHVIFMDAEDFCKAFCCNFTDNKASHGYTKNFMSLVS